MLLIVADLEVLDAIRKSIDVLLESSGNEQIADLLLDAFRVLGILDFHFISDLLIGPPVHWNFADAIAHRTVDECLDGAEQLLRIVENCTELLGNLLTLLVEILLSFRDVVQHREGCDVDLHMLVPFELVCLLMKRKKGS